MDMIGMLLDRQSQMESRRSNFERLWERVSQLVQTNASGFTSKQPTGVQRNTQQYDAFPALALDKFSAAIESALTPRTATWHNLVTGNPDLDVQQDVAVFLEELNQLMWDYRYSPLANFSSQAQETRMNLGAFGTGCMMVTPRHGGGCKYRNIDLNEIFIDENSEGWIDLTHRKFEMTARQAVQEFGDATPKRVLDKLNLGKVLDRFEFIHCVAPNEDHERGMIDSKPFTGYYVFPEGKEIVREEGYFEQPYIVSRYSVATREIYGRSVATSLLPDISMLNEQRRTTIEAANLALDPAILLQDDIGSEFDFVAGAKNYGGLDDNGGELAKVFNPNVNVRIGLEMMQDTRNQIDDGFLGAYFKALLNNPNMTATQAMMLQQQQGIMVSPVISRLQSEWLGPLLRRESGILFRQGKHPEMPESLKSYLSDSGEPLRIEYQSPMTRAARAEEAVGIMRTIESLGPMAQVDPSVFNVLDMAEMARTIAEINGVPAKSIKSKDAIAADQAKKDQQQQLGDVLQAAPIAAQTAKTLAETQALSQNAPSPIGVAQ